ncbi:MAG: hypothetical protein ABSF72_03940 [Candidatus Sulfotelmatobacter sp.]
MDINRTPKVSLWIGSTIILTIVGALLLLPWYTHGSISLRGAVTVQDTDSRKEQPIADVEVTADLATNPVKSDSTGLFTLPLRGFVRRGHPLVLHFRQPHYLPLDVSDFVGDKLYIVHMLPVPAVAPSATRPAVKVANVHVRYSGRVMTEFNVGSAVKTFQIENKGNVPCKGQRPCSPDGKWRAALGSASLDAGTGNEFRSARASCIAGPCPFTKIESDHVLQGEQIYTVSARDWSDTATFLLEAEVVHPMVSQIVHESYPVIFGEGLNFTLPSTAEGVSIEAELDGQMIIFPLGPELFLSWASCNARVNPDQTKVYRCDLKPGYSFQ